MTDEPAMPPEPPRTAEQDARDRRIWWMLVGIGVVIVLGIMLLLWPIIRGRLDAAKGLDTAAVVISQSDPEVELIARTVSAEPSAESTEVLVAVQRKIPAVRSGLARSVALLDAGFNRLTDDEQRRATLTRAVLASRVAMLDAAAPIVSAESSANAASPVATDAWNTALLASHIEKEAVSAYDLKTPAGLAQAGALANQAAAGFADAGSAFGRAGVAYPAAKLGVYAAYMQQRVEQLQLLKRAIAARQAGNIAQANVLVAAYNASQTKSAAAAKALPATPTQAVADAFKTDTAAKRAAFDKAQSDANDADAALKSL